MVRSGRATPGTVERPAVPYDEMYLEPGQPRPTHEPLAEALRALGPAGLAERARQRDAYLDAQGITFTLSGRERPLPLDLVPRILQAEEWRRIEAGVVQRIRALEAFLADLYADGEVLSDGVVPRRLITSSTHFHRAAHGVVPPTACGSTSPAST